MGDAGFIRVRMGIGRPVHGDVTNFVLQNFSSDEQIDLETTVDTGANAVECVAKFGTVKAMNEFNKRQGDKQ